MKVRSTARYSFLGLLFSLSTPCLSISDTKKDWSGFQIEKNVAATSLVYESRQHRVAVALEDCTLTTYDLSSPLKFETLRHSLEACSFIEEQVAVGQFQSQLSLHTTNHHEPSTITALNSTATEPNQVKVVKKDDRIIVATMEKTDSRLVDEYSIIRLMLGGEYVDYTTTDDYSVELSDLMVFQDSLWLLGCTKGSGPAFGGERPSKNAYYLNSFLTRIDPSDGHILQTAHLGKRFYNNRATSMCSDGHNSLYVVGTTDAIWDPNHPRNRMDGFNFAFLTKLNHDSLEPIWIRQIGATTGPLYHTEQVWTGPEAHGIACAVSGNQVVLAGVLLDGAVLNLEGTHQSYGGTDVFVAHFDSEGNRLFAKQIGTDRDETLKDVAIDRDGNALLLGNTKGSLLRDKLESDSLLEAFVAVVGNEKCKTRMSASSGTWREECGADVAVA